MSSDQHSRATKIFLTVAELPPEQRASYLDQACGSDRELRTYVEKLLAHDSDDSFLQPPVAPAAPGRLPEIIGDFRLLRKIGQGGMGTVYEVEQISLQRKVALKVLPAHLSFSDESIRKFQREAEAGGRQSHPGIVAVHAVGEHGGFHYIAQELVGDGTTLQDRLEELRQTGEPPSGYFRQVAQLIAEVAAALQQAHNSGVIHRDIKPSNILIVDRWTPKVTDFGLARVEDALALSRTGELAGTPYYMSPEQAMSKRIGIDRRTDIYSLGVTLYEMLTLKRPFEGDSSQEILKKIMLVDPADPHRTNPRVPRDLSVICLKAMEKLPSRRYQSMDEFGADLARFHRGDVILARPAGIGTRLLKHVKRNPVVSTAAGVAFLSVMALLLYVLLWSYPQIRQERNVAESRLEEITRLSDMKRLDDLRAEAKVLWPAHPESVPALKAWLVRADQLLGRLEEHRQRLATLRGRALSNDQETVRRDRETHPKWIEAQELKGSVIGHREQVEYLEGVKRGVYPTGIKASLLSSIDWPGNIAELEEWISRLEQAAQERRTWNFENVETQWQHDALARLVSGLEELEDVEQGLVTGVENRLAIAETVEQRSIGDHHSAWDEVRRSVAEDPVYEGLDLKPQLGLVPIGRDPNSKLWEFVHLQTGEAPVRGEDGRLEIKEETGLVFILVPGGRFTMGSNPPTSDNPAGSPNVDPRARWNDIPTHEVTITPYFLSKYEMTQGQWQRFTGENPSFWQPGVNYGLNVVTFLNPVDQVSWTDCHQTLTCLGLRLPSDAEWEYATRAGTTTIWWTGNDEQSLAGAVNLCDSHYWTTAGQRGRACEQWLDDGWLCTAPVGSYRPNPFGLHDTAGNVWEWCQDLYREYDLRDAFVEYDPLDVYELKTPTDGSAFDIEGFPSRGRVIRGGCWFDTAYLCRSSYRFWREPQYRSDFSGVRPARSVN